MDDYRAAVDLAPGKRSALMVLVDDVVGKMAQAASYDEHHARQVIIAQLMRLYADEDAYARIAESRGLLPL